MDAPSFRKFEVSHVIATYFPRGNFGRDKQHHPIVYFAFGCIDPQGLISSESTRACLEAMLTFQEHTRCLCEDISKELGIPLYQCIYILDLKHISKRHLWKPGLDVFLQIANTLEQQAPETVYRVYVLNAPSVFNIIYSLVRPILDENTQRKIVVLGEDFKETLLRDISADQLPVYYGGTCTDINGDEKCTHAISYGGIVPPEVYYKDIHRPPQSELETISVNRGNERLIELHVTEKHSKIAWYLKSTTPHDIGFGVFYKESESQTSPNDMKMVVPYFRLLAYFVPERGELQVKRPGTYVIWLNNKYSWLYSKSFEFWFKAT